MKSNKNIIIKMNTMRMLDYISKAKKRERRYKLLILITGDYKIYAHNSYYNEDYEYYKNGQL